MVKRLNNQGVTLVELMVALSLFAVMIAVSVGIFSAILNVQAQANNIRGVQQNMRFAFESFFREARLAQDFYNSGQETDTEIVCNTTPSPGFVSGSDDLNLLTTPFIIKNFRGEIIRYKVINVNGRNAFVAENIGNQCEDDPMPETILTELTGPDVSVASLRIFRDTKYDANNKPPNPPALLTIQMKLNSYPQSDREAVNQSIESEVSISVRGEFCHFNPEFCI